MRPLARIASLATLLLLWQIASWNASPRYLPPPVEVFAAIGAEARSGALLTNLSATLGRVAAAFAVAMALGTALGVAMGRHRPFDAVADPWLLVLLNAPALVVIVLAYIWAGLTEAAAIAAVALNKLPNTVVTVREGARALDVSLDEMAQVFRMSAAAR